MGSTSRDCDGFSSDAGAASSGPPALEEIFLLARQDSFPAVIKLLDAQPELWTASDADGHTLLHWGALIGRKEFVELALSKGCPVDARANNNQTPLMWAALRGHVPVARVLLDAKADLHAKDSLGATPLIIAVQHQNHKSMLLLMHRGKDENDSLGGCRALLADSDNLGCTAAHWAAYKGDLPSLQLINYFDGDLMALDNMKMTPLHRAVCAAKPEVVEFLVKQGSNPSQCNGEGKSCLDIAEEGQDIRMQGILKKAIKQHGADAPNIDVPNGKEVDIEGGTGRSPSSPSGGKSGKANAPSLFTQDDKQKAFPVFWLVCVSLATFQYIIDMRDTSYTVAPRASLLFELGVPVSLCIFAWVMFADPGKVPARPKGNSGVEELMRGLDGGAPEDSLPDVTRLCTTTWVLKDYRTKYCTVTGACVREFDHYCVWLNTAIGRGNHRQFILLAMTEALTQACHIYLCFTMALHFVEYESLIGWLIGVCTGYPLLLCITMVQGLTMPWVCVLVKQHFRGIAINMTTNEVINLHRYEHFWIQRDDGVGGKSKRFRNPFNKGGTWANTLDFWVHRRRSDTTVSLK